MTKAEHTPGPWRLEASETLSAILCGEDEKYESIAFLTLPNHQANARLIASAPDMLEALERALSMLDALRAESGRGVEWGEEDAFRMGEWFEQDEIAAMDAARAAIAKAKGDAG
jgi:hypothetical protein